MQIPYTRRSAPVALLAVTVAFSACGEDPILPGIPAISGDVTSLDFGGVDVDFGAGMDETVTLTNNGSAAVNVGPFSLSGAQAGDFEIADPTGAVNLAPGTSVEIAVSFDPTATGARMASLDVPTDDEDTGTLSIDLMGSGDDYTFTQVDRVGIPALNTVFNHPPQFSKTDYNVASPMGDVAAYTGLFETVLEAVANADPSATAALLLPDELPVDMGAGMTSFGTLTGRALADDATDVALTVVVGVEELHSDNVDTNDVAFSAAFPYLAAPHN